jgi:phospholipase C
VAGRRTTTRFRRYGLRVPAFVVSPWVVKGSVSKQVYDHTSLLSTILHRFCLQPDGSIPSMGQRADHALDLDSMLSADTPNLSPQKAPDASNCQAAAQVNVVHRSTSFGEVLRKSLLRF